MQISDLVKQYHQAISSGAETLTGTKGVENLVPLAVSDKRKYF